VKKLETASMFRLAIDTPSPSFQKNIIVSKDGQPTVITGTLTAVHYLTLMFFFLSSSPMHLKISFAVAD